MPGSDSIQLLPQHKFLLPLPCVPYSELRHGAQIAPLQHCEVDLLGAIPGPVLAADDPSHQLVDHLPVRVLVGVRQPLRQGEAEVEAVLARWQRRRSVLPRWRGQRWGRAMTRQGGSWARLAADRTSGRLRRRESPSACNRWEGIIGLRN